MFVKTLFVSPHFIKSRKQVFPTFFVFFASPIGKTHFFCSLFGFVYFFAEIFDRDLAVEFDFLIYNPNIHALHSRSLLGTYSIFHFSQNSVWLPRKRRKIIINK